MEDLTRQEIQMICNIMQRKINRMEKERKNCKDIKEFDEINSEYIDEIKRIRKKLACKIK